MGRAPRLPELRTLNEHHPAPTRKLHATSLLLREVGGVGTIPRGTLPPMTIDQLVVAIRRLPVQQRLRVIELAAHDVATDVTRQLPNAVEATSALGITLIDRPGFLVAHGEAGVVLPEEVFDHRVDREAREERLSGGS